MDKLKMILPSTELHLFRNSVLDDLFLPAMGTINEMYSGALKDLRLIG
jgi:hypothetical protein